MLVSINWLCQLQKDFIIYMSLKFTYCYNMHTIFCFVFFFVFFFDKLSCLWQLIFFQNFDKRVQSLLNNGVWHMTHFKSTSGLYLQGFNWSNLFLFRDYWHYFGTDVMRTRFMIFFFFSSFSKISKKTKNSLDSTIQFRQHPNRQEQVLMPTGQAKLLAFPSVPLLMETLK